MGNKERAHFIRQVSNSLGLEETARRVCGLMYEVGIPSIIVGGYAVQERGYPRYTTDLDLAVADAAAARQLLIANGFLGQNGSLVDPDSGFPVHLIPGGKTAQSVILPVPMPRMLRRTPIIADTETLISGKLAIYMSEGIRASRHFADVIELLQRNDLPRGLGLAPPVREGYCEIWDALHMPAELVPSFRCLPGFVGARPPVIDYRSLHGF